MFRIHHLLFVYAFALFLAACNDDNSSPSAPSTNDEIPSSDSRASNDNSSGSNTSDNSVSSSSAQKDSLIVSYGTMTDSRDGRTYKTITLGKLTWMAENLKFDYTVNDASYGSQCSGNDEANCEKQGRLYTWGAAMDSAGVFSKDGFGCGNKTACYPYKRVRGICPEGWHLPNKINFTSEEATAFLATTDSVYTYISNYLIKDDFHYILFWTSKEDDYENSYAAYATTRSEITTYEARLYYDRIPVRCVMDYKEDILNILELSISKETRFNPNIDYGTMTDARDGKTYKTVKIGNQTWIAENLNYDVPIPADSENVSWCYADKEELCDIMGRYYNIKAIFGEDINTLPECTESWTNCKPYAEDKIAYQSICPDGWHLPNKTEWETLFDEVGGIENSAFKLTSTSGWISEEGLNTSGFSAIPAGQAFINTNVFIYVRPNRYMTFGHNTGRAAAFWSANGVKTGEDYGRFFAGIETYNTTPSLETNLFFTTDDFYYSVRCLKNAE